MITFFNSKTVFMGTDMRKFNEMREFLKRNGVKYKYKVNTVIKNKYLKWEDSIVNLKLMNLINYLDPR